MLKFKVELTKFVIVKLLELELVIRGFPIVELLIIEEFLIELSKDEERDISPVEEDSLNLLNN